MLDPRYVTSVDLAPYLVDRVTGLPLANGTIEFWEDANRSVPKIVYELTGSPPNYTYTALPNPVPINAVGNISDNTGNNIALYYFPYDSMDEATANLQLYYVVVKDESGNVQFTREAWPNVTAATNPIGSNNNTVINQLSNPQFVDVFFNPAAPYVIPFTGNTNINIAPDWQLQITATGSGTVTVTRNAIAGSLQVPTNPPYTITFNPSGDISALNLVQTLYHNPDIWSPGPSGTNGWIATNITFDSVTELTVLYAPSAGTTQTLLQDVNVSGTVLEFTNIVQLITPDNPDTGTSGYVDIVIQMSPTGITTLTSVQVVGLETISDGVEYNQAPVNRQYDQLFHHYNQPLQYKPIASYLVGWDFPVNPAQALGSSVSAFATGTNTSNYVWDQTIAFQTVTSGVSFSRDSNSGGLVVTAAATGQFSLIQYLDMPIAYEVLNGPLSVNISAVTNVMAGVEGVVSLWYCTDVNLPLIGSNLSIVNTMNTDGSINARHGNWAPVPRVNLPPAQFTVMPNTTTNFNDYGFNGWDLQGVSAVNTATYFAIVVGFAPMASTNTITFNSISLVPGSIATRPAPQTVGDVLMDCYRYYETSYPSNVVPGTATVPLNVVTSPMQSTLKNAGNNVVFIGQTFSILYKNKKRVTAPTVAVYSNNSGTIANVYGTISYVDNTITGGSSAASDLPITSWILLLGDKSAKYTIATNSLFGAPSAAIGAGADTYRPGSAWINYHYTVDSRLGVV